MEKWIEVFSSWPIIIQGALGSALFWLVLTLTQRIVNYLTRRFADSSKEARVNYLVNKQIMCNIALAKDDAKAGAYLSALIYRCFRPLIRAFMWLAMGLLFQSVQRIFGIVGYLGSLYYLLEAYDMMRPRKIKDPAKELREIDKELATLREGKEK